MRIRSFIFCSLILAGTVLADVRLATVFGDGMVLQQAMRAPVWGTAADGEKITVTFNGQQLSTIAAEGKWRIDLAAMKAGGPWPMTVVGNNTIEVKNVYVGEVWICSGQSNMWWPVQSCTTAAEAALEKTDLLHLSYTPGTWQMAEGAAIQRFSGTGYYFGKMLAEKLKMPVGLIQAAVGGTAAELWTPLDTLKTLGYTSGGSLYTQYITPLQPYAIRGVIWYQGESNVGQATKYQELFSAMIQSWRAAWGQGNFLFLFVQLPRINGKPANPVVVPGDGWALLREQQARTLSVPNTGMAVYFDATDGNLHPPDKKVIGERLALLAGGMIYSVKKADAISPTFKAAKRLNNTIALSFNTAESGLVAKDTPDSPVNDLFWVAADGTVLPAKARVMKQAVVLESPQTADLPDLYYAWSSYPQGNVFSAAGLPVSPFRLQTLRLKVSERKENEITLSANLPLDPRSATNTASYKITGAVIRRAVLMEDGKGVRLIADRPVIANGEQTLSFPGLLRWDNTPVTSIVLDVGQVAP